MKFAEIKVGQLVKHNSGFKGIVEKIEEATDPEWSDIIIRVTEKGSSNYAAGHIYNALPGYFTLLEDVKDTSTEFKVKLGTDIHFEGTFTDFEKLYELIKKHN